MGNVAAPAGWDDPVLDVEVCSVCGSDLEWQDCDGCDDGLVDEYDDDPINVPPGTWLPCEQCGGKGGWLGCPNADQHQRRAS